MAWSATPVVSLAEGLGSNGGTSSGVDTTGADSLWIVLGYATTNTPAVSDSKGNTWSLQGPQDSGFGHRIALYYAESAIVGSGHTFTATVTGGNVGIAIIAFSGGKASGMADQHADSFAVFASMVQAGSITPSENDCLIIAGFASPGGSYSAVNESYTVPANVAQSGSNFGVAVGYKLQTTATATNPTWTATDSFVQLAALGSYKAGAGAPPPSGNPWYYFRHQ